jgi:hypothetical protein
MLKTLLPNMLTLGLLQISLAAKAQTAGHLLRENEARKVLKSIYVFVWNSITNNANFQFNSIQFFIISVLHQQPEGQLQMQHKG